MQNDDFTPRTEDVRGLVSNKREVAGLTSSHPPVQTISSAASPSLLANDGWEKRARILPGVDTAAASGVGVANTKAAKPTRLRRAALENCILT